MTPDQAAKLAQEWSREFDTWREVNRTKYWRHWDKLPPETRAQLEAILEAGYDNITREKVGDQPATDAEAMAIVHRHQHPIRRRLRR